MLEIITLPVGQLCANCYLIIDKKTRQCLIIDPGDEAEYIENTIRDKNCQPIAIICTHGHFDHTGGVLELKLAYHIPFYISQKDEFLLKSARRSARYYSERNKLVYSGIDIGPMPSIDGYLKEDKILKIGETRLGVLDTPGHTPGSICLYNQERNILFTGDTLFKQGLGRTDFYYSNKKDFKKSLQKIFKLPQDTVIYPGHGETSSLEKEKSTQVFHF